MLGKTITVEVGFAPGGAAATEALVVARHLGEFVPGHPSVVVGYRPGAGGRVLNNYLYNLASANGLEIGRVDNGVAVANLLDDSTIKFESDKFGWIGSFASDGWALFLRLESGINTFAALQGAKTNLKIGSISAVHKTYTNARLLQEVFGMRFDMITGYPSGKDIELAVARRELDGSVAAYAGFYQRSFRTISIRRRPVPLQSGRGEAHEPAPGLEKVPTILSSAPSKPFHC